MATIAKIDRNGTIRYRVIIKKNRKPIATKTFTRKTAATAWAKRVEASHELMQALGSKGNKLTLSQLADEYMSQWNGKDWPNQISRVKWWVDQLGKHHLMDITADEIRAALAKYANGKARRGDGVDKCGRFKTIATRKNRSPATVNRMRAVLSSMFKFAISQGYVSKNPVQQVPSRSTKNRRERYLSDDERKRLLDACKQSAWPKLHLLVLMALTTGARLGELLNLRWSDIDFNHQTGYLHETKNGESRLITIPTATLNELKPYRGVGDQLLFPSARKPGRPFEFRKHWKQALETARIKNFRFHDTRHTAASTLVMNGATLYETGEVLGHKSLETTKRYAHLSVEHRAALTERILGNLAN